MRRATIKKRTLFISTIFFLLIFQNGFESISDSFSYIDEAIALIGVVFIIISVDRRRKALKNRKLLKVILLILVFFFSGLAGNILFSYQPILPVLIDAFTNIKFFLCIALGYLLFKENIRDDLTLKMQLFAKSATVFFASLSIIDVAFNVFPSQYRYGIKSLVMFYSHPTYFAGALCSIILVLVCFYNKSCYKYIVTDLMMMALTLRSKAIAAAGVIAFITWYVLKKKKKLSKWQIGIAGIVAVGTVWEQISFYYIELRGRSARSVLTLTSFKIIRDYFPIGTGFATFGSNMAKLFYSPVYVKYGFLMINEVSANNQSTYLNDTFWPIIFGQTGAIGSIAYIIIIGYLFANIWNLKFRDKNSFCASLCAFLYLLISSTAEPAFNNSISIMLAMIIGISFRKSEEKLLVSI